MAASSRAPGVSKPRPDGALVARSATRPPRALDRHARRSGWPLGAAGPRRARSLPSGDHRRAIHSAPRPGRAVRVVSARSSQGGGRDRGRPRRRHATEISTPRPPGRPGATPGDPRRRNVWPHELKDTVRGLVERFAEFRRMGIARHGHRRQPAHGRHHRRSRQDASPSQCREDKSFIARAAEATCVDGDGTTMRRARQATGVR